ncbi:MAG: helix-turn-helix domain-containing protein [Actinomycetota bacterium]|nr:helix-turn-helix domain-containing protein [Actinomycetota bacterium]
MQAFLTREEAAETLRVSVSTVDRLVKSGKLRATILGRRVLISPAAIAELEGRVVVVSV